MRRLIIIFICLTLTVSSLFSQSIDHSLWVATDALGRKVVESAPAKSDKIVAMFYWTWHCGHMVKGDKARNISSILRAHPEAENSMHPAWEIDSRKSKLFFWEEPLLGYYRTTDPWVLRKHAEWLADAGIDVVFFDCSNGSYNWKESYDVLLSTWAQALKDGVDVPKIAFLLPFAPYNSSKKTLHFLYNDIYSCKRFSELWFIKDGKPFILAYPDNLDDNSPREHEIKQFFTFRSPQPDYVDGKSRDDHWSWLEVYPQNMYGPGNTKEQMSVSVAQNANPASGGHCYAFNAPNSFGRSHTVVPNNDKMKTNSHLWGYNFQEQWERALESDPQIVFVTGWNEFVADQHISNDTRVGWPPSNPMKPFAFPDQYNWEYSRDIEPVKNWGEYGDNYYMQLVNNVRKFKGVAQRPKSSAPKAIRANNWSDWDNVQPTYDHYKGNTFARNHQGYCNLLYTNNSGRNDLVRSKVARDNKSVYFYIETSNNITKPQGDHWMTLFINTDRDNSTGWCGYDLVVNRLMPNRNRVVIERNVGNDWIWETVASSDYYLKNTMLYFSVPINLLRVHDRLEFEFKWNDNMQNKGDVLDFYVNGDTAPTGRFNFLYKLD